MAPSGDVLQEYFDIEPFDDESSVIEHFISERFVID
jgi:hypothetical protein